MEQLNYFLFLAINASGQASDTAVVAARFAAQWLVFLPPAVIAGLWIWGAPPGRGALIATSIGLLVGLGINQIIGELWSHPRPFMVGIGRTLMAHTPEASFPSDHATFVWSLSLGLIATRYWRIWGWSFVMAGLLVAWARIYLGLHFPFDMAGSFVVSLVAAGIARGLQPGVDRRLLPVVEALYEFLLRRLHLPATIFPRPFV